MLVHDKPGNLDGGKLRLYIDSPDLAGTDTEVTLFDDVAAENMSYPGAYYGYCANKLSDCHSWDSSHGVGYFTWSWTKQAADGMVRLQRLLSYHDGVHTQPACARSTGY